jgi:hypothetical protein
LYLQAQAQAAQAQRQQSEQLHRDFHLRQALQDQIGRQLNLERLRGLPAGFLDDNPDIHALRAELELRELEGQRQLEEQRLTEQEILRQQVAAQLRFQDDLLRQHQQLGGFPTQDDAVLAQQRAQAIAQAQAQMQAAQAHQVAQERAKAQQMVQERVKAHLVAQAAQELDPTLPEMIVGATGYSVTSKGKTSKHHSKAGKGKAGAPKSLKGQAKLQSDKYIDDDRLYADTTDTVGHRAVKKPKAERKRKAESINRRRSSASSQPGHKPLAAKRAKKVDATNGVEAENGSAYPAGYVSKKSHLNHEPQFPTAQASETALDAFVIAADLSSPWIEVEIPRKGTFEGLLEAAADTEKVDVAADLLCALKNDCERVGSLADEGEKEHMGLDLPFVPSTPAETLKVGNLISELPALPQEPEADLSDVAYEYPKVNDKESEGADSLASLRARSLNQRKSPDAKPRLYLDYAINVDSWWPSPEQLRLEHRGAGVSSDEDDLEVSRGNVKKVRHRLATRAEPGVLQKLNHCRIHRVRTKDKKMSNNTPELVFCFQVTELYPNDIMVSCSMCGTWRHAACGGHWKPYSTRDNC